MLEGLNTPFIWGVFFVFILGFSVPYNAAQISTSKERHFLPPPPALKHFAFGYNGMLADLLWIRAIQDNDYCEERAYPEAKCKDKGWLFQMLHEATELDPKYRMIYLLGTTMLSLLVEDVAGGTIMYDKAILNFPKDWKIAHRAAYHFVEMDPNFEKAASLYRRSAENGGPAWDYSLAARILTDNGRKEAAQAMYEELKKSEVPQYVIDRIEARLKR